MGVSLLYRLGHAEPIMGMICCGSHIWAGGKDLRIWDAKTAELVLTSPTGQVYYMAAVDFLGVSTVWLGLAGQIVVWDAKKHVMVRTLECEGVCHCIVELGVGHVWVGTRLESNSSVVEWKVQ
jgi:hypothetical protein